MYVSEVSAAMGRQTVTVRNKTITIRRRKTTLVCRAAKVSGEYLLKTCVGFHPICTITELVCFLKLQHGRSSVPQIGRRARQETLRVSLEK